MSDEWISSFLMANISYNKILTSQKKQTDDVYFGLDFSRLLLGSIYAILSAGSLANLTVALLVIQILLARNQGNWDSTTSSFNSGQNAHILIYILSLSVVDCLVMLNAGVVSTTIFFQSWIFPRWMCTAYYAIDSVNKTLSTFILTILSLDRFLAIRYPQRQFRVRSFKGAICVLSICLFSAFLLLLPVYIQTDIIQVPVVHEGRNETTPTCAFVGESNFAIVLAVFGFFVPLILMCCFYFNMLASLRKRRNELSKKAVSYGPSSASNRSLVIQKPRILRIRTVTKRTLLLVLFHFGCWTPYWLSTFYVMLFAQSELNDIDVIVMYIVHIGTYLNSAVNPILYALLNKDLRRRRNTLRKKRRRRAAAIEATSAITE